MSGEVNNKLKDFPDTGPLHYLVLSSPVAFEQATLRRSDLTAPGIANPRSPLMVNYLQKALVLLGRFEYF